MPLDVMNDTEWSEGKKKLGEIWAMEAHPALQEDMAPVSPLR